MGHVGQQIFHVFVCNDPTHSFLVHSCSVDDGRGVRFDLVSGDKLMNFASLTIYLA